MMNKIKTDLSIKDRIIPHDYWQVSRSGKVLELRVIPAIDQDPIHYRLCVVQIGRIIYKIKSFEGNSKTEPRIQLFPNLAENQLVATIYWPQLLNSEIQITPQKKKSETYSATFIQTLLKKYSLILKKYSRELTPLQEKHGRCWFAIFSSTNQPFIWLKLGQFIEEFKHLVKNDPEFSLEDVELIKSDKTISHKPPHKLFLQALLHLPQIEKHNHTKL